MRCPAGVLSTGSCLHASSNASYGLPVVEFEVPERSVKTLPSAVGDIISAGFGKVL